LEKEQCVAEAAKFIADGQPRDRGFASPINLIERNGD
jgi:hypothetical protein